jgi:hypothetical protein
MKYIFLLLIFFCNGCTLYFTIGKQIDADEIIIRKYKSQTDLPPELLAVIESLMAADAPPMAGSGYIAPGEKEAVARRADRRCEICFTDLYPGGCFIGEYAHIKGERPGSARHDPTLAETNTADNLLLLCPNCHTVADKCPDDWPVEFLEFCKKRSAQWNP